MVWEREPDLQHGRQSQQVGKGGVCFKLERTRFSIDMASLLHINIPLGITLVQVVCTLMKDLAVSKQAKSCWSLPSIPHSFSDHVSSPAVWEELYGSYTAARSRCYKYLHRSPFQSDRHFPLQDKLQLPKSSTARVITPNLANS